MLQAFFAIEEKTVSRELQKFELQKMKFLWVTCIYNMYCIKHENNWNISELPISVSIRKSCRFVQRQSNLPIYGKNTSDSRTMYNKESKKVYSRNIGCATGNALKRDHTYESYICTADSIRLNVKRSRDGNNYLLSTSRSLIFILARDDDGRCRSLAKRPRGNDGKWYSKRKRD